ncbi:BA14K family protein [Mesorhizobium sp. WSM2239]|uniref:Lectin-like protein BA14k n=2 Tax=unclassified Mesorhizobium TaxID=325217 RepID=A0AAU8DEJ8_9HYPH
MNRILKTAILSAAVAATTFAAMPAANAGDNWRRHHRDHSSDGDLVAAGILGLAVGALAVGAANASRPEYRVYDDYDYPRDRRYYPRDRRYYPVRRERVYVDEGYAGALEPWTPEWYRYCEDRYRSFNARTGTFTGYDGRRHFCVAG